MDIQSVTGVPRVSKTSMTQVSKAAQFEKGASQGASNQIALDSKEQKEQNLKLELGRHPPLKDSGYDKFKDEQYLEGLISGEIPVDVNSLASKLVDLI
ncbi:hypothetical protein [Vibrio alginolyticus]|uniref:hypothetical protein n=1 Tax=Vibrio TaxID=662 RepID=UPI0006CA7F27|nr:hypothetical protein [Vibrio alginolyticus]KPM98588.1 hypothetical protein AOG25_09125 [Vibrio alginolyticus]CAH7157450.1 conserved hypothetical protein [Vibrio chagasii]CAH7327095.1 conserved hypothetical protein [Vibrio chagasii]